MNLGGGIHTPVDDPSEALRNPLSGDIVRPVWGASIEFQGFNAQKHVDSEPLARLKHRRPELFQYLERDAEVMLAKATDYADEDSYRNLRECEEMGVPAWQGVAIRLCDKFRRLKNFVKRGEYAVKDESFYDTIGDARNYLLFLEHLHREAQEKDA